MDLKVVSRFALAFTFAIGAAVAACGSVSTVSDAGSPGTAGTSGGGTSGAAGTAGTAGAGGTTGVGGAGGATDGGALTCRTDVAGDCPTGFTCACGGPGPGVCTCHRNCSDVSQCPMAEPMCGCPSTVGGARYCVNACFCTCN